MDEKLESTLWNIPQRNLGEPEFIEAVKDVLESIGTVLAKYQGSPNKDQTNMQTFRNSRHG